MVVSPEDSEAAGDQTVPLATICADSGASSGAAVLHALAQLCETMVMLVGEGEMGHARAVHEAIGCCASPCLCNPRPKARRQGASRCRSLPGRDARGIPVHGGLATTPARRTACRSAAAVGTIGRFGDPAEAGDHPCKVQSASNGLLGRHVGS